MPKYIELFGSMFCTVCRLTFLRNQILPCFHKYQSNSYRLTWRNWMISSDTWSFFICNWNVDWIYWQTLLILKETHPVLAASMLNCTISFMDQRRDFIGRWWNEKNRQEHSSIIDKLVSKNRSIVQQKCLWLNRVDALSLCHHIGVADKYFDRPNRWHIYEQPIDIPSLHLMKKKERTDN